MQSLPIYSTQAGGEFGAVFFMMCHALAALSVTGTVFRTRAIYVIMWTGHTIYRSNASVKILPISR